MIGSLFDDEEPPPAPAPPPPPDLEPRTWWTFERELVEIRGASPMMVWFTRLGEPVTAQRTAPRTEFLKKAKRTTAPAATGD